MSESIYHITSRKNWEDAKTTGEYRAETLTGAGFIHCSSKEQVLRVANSFYAHQKGLVLLEIEPNRLHAQLRWEMGTDSPNELFPHIYGPVNLEAVIEVLDLSANPDGYFSFPKP